MARSFDRVADVYDETRRMPDDVVRRVVDTIARKMEPPNGPTNRLGLHQPKSVSAEVFTSCARDSTNKKIGLTESQRRQRIEIETSCGASSGEGE